MPFPELVRSCRSRRKFRQDISVSKQTLLELVDNARLTPSAKNLQPLKYLITNTPERNALVFPHLRWAGYLQEGGIYIPEGSRPAAYIVVLGDTSVSPSFSYDPGVAAQTIMLGAAEKGLGGCIIASIMEAGLRDALKIGDRFEVLLVLALGVPDETVVIENRSGPDAVRYWRDPDGTHHVPKRPLEEIILNNGE